MNGPRSSPENPAVRSDRTMLGDGRIFPAALERQLSRAERYWESFVVVLIESEGPVSAALASVLAASVRRCDLAAWLSDDRFAVLLVRADAFAEDSPLNMKLLRALLRMEGCEVPEVATGEEAQNARLRRGPT